MARILWNSGIATTRIEVIANFIPGNFGLFRWNPWQPLAETWGSAEPSAVARVSEAPPEISRGAPHTLLAYYYELQ